MLKLILCSLILSYCLPGFAVAQSNSNTLKRNSGFDPEKDEIVSKAVMKLVQKDLEHYQILKLENHQLKTALDSVMENCSVTVTELKIYFSRLEKKNKELKTKNERHGLELEKAAGQVKNYKAIAQKKTVEAMMYKKYQSAAAIRFGELILVETIFAVVIWGVLRISK